MFPTDYSSSFNIDGIATDDFDKQFVLVSLDDNNIVSFTTDPDGNLKSKENPSEYKDSLSKDKKYNKIRIRKLLKKSPYLILTFTTCQSSMKPQMMNIGKKSRKCVD